MTADPLAGDEPFVYERLQRVALVYARNGMDPTARFYQVTADELLRGKLTASEAAACLPPADHPVWTCPVYPGDLPRFTRTA